MGANVVVKSHPLKCLYFSIAFIKACFLRTCAFFVKNLTTEV